MVYLGILCAYLLGSIPFALVVGKGIFRVDLRKTGSGNLGATNTFRILGKKTGFLVLTLDILKGALAASLPVIFSLDGHPLVFGLAAIIGHSFPIFAQFKGGKSVATSTGIFLFYKPLLILVATLIFLALLKKYKYVSLSSVCANGVLFVLSIGYSDLFLSLVSFFIFTFILYRHRSNLVRIKRKEEPKVTWI